MGNRLHVWYRSGDEKSPHFIYDHWGGIKAAREVIEIVERERFSDLDSMVDFFNDPYDPLLNLDDDEAVIMPAGEWGDYHDSRLIVDLNGPTYIIDTELGDTFSGNRAEILKSLLEWENELANEHDW